MDAFGHAFRYAQSLVTAACACTVPANLQYAFFVLEDIADCLDADAPYLGKFLRRVMLLRRHYVARLNGASSFVLPLRRLSGVGRLPCAELFRGAEQFNGFGKAIVGDHLDHASEDEATLVGVYGDYLQVEAFVKPSQISVRANGEWVTGDQAYAVASD